MAQHEGTPEPAQNPADLLGGPDRAEYQTEFGGPEPADRKDVLGGPDRAEYQTEFGGPEPIDQKDVLGGPDADPEEDELRPPAGAGEQRNEESRMTHGHREGHHGPVS